jgi:hypothetical protein
MACSGVQDVNTPLESCEPQRRVTRRRAVRPCRLPKLTAPTSKTYSPVTLSSSSDRTLSEGETLFN